MEMKNKRKFVMLGIAVGAFVIGYILYALLGQQKESAMDRVVKPSSPVPPRASMFFSPDTINTTVGETITVDVIVEANGAIINGLDSIVTFDPGMIDVVEIRHTPPQTDTLTDQFILARKQIELNQVNLTKIKIEANDTPTGRLYVASLVLRPKRTGTARLQLSFTPNQTSASTIIKAEGNEMILDEVSDASIVIE